MYIPELEKIQRALFIKKCQDDFYFFTKEAWKYVEVEEYYDNWHIEAVCRHLESVEKGDVLELCIMLPPGHMKSLLTAVLFPVWVWLKRPYTRWIFATYSGEFSLRDAGKRLKLIRSDWYREMCDFGITRDAVGRVENKQGGFFLATSTGGIGTGERAHYCVNDDLLRMNDADSPAYRQEAITHMEAMGNRGVSQDGYRQITAAQRLDPEDPIGWALAQGWFYFSLPVDQPGKSTVFPDWVDPRKEGDILFPARFGLEYLEKQRRSLGSRKYEGQYRQNPTIPEGNIIKRSWIKYYQMLPETFDIIIQSWDCAVKDKDTSDFVAGHVWGKAGGRYYLIGRIHKQLGFDNTMKAVRYLSSHFPKALKKIIEDKANGSPAGEMLKKEMSGIILRNPKGSKIERIKACEPLFEAGDVFFPHPSINSSLWDITDMYFPDNTGTNNPTINDLIDELCGFPAVKHDDNVDVISQALIELAGLTGTPTYSRPAVSRR